jgi:hypothetical protein
MMRGLLLAALLASGCQFDGGLGTGYLCPTGECPEGQVCQDGVCTLGARADAAADPDGGRRADAGDLSDAAIGANLVDNPGMEEGTLPWTPYNSVLSEHLEPHEGTSALLVCNSGVTGDFTVYQDVLKAPDEPIPQGQRYAASIWVTSATGTTTPGMMKLTIRESGGATARVDHDGALVGGPGDAWIELQASGTVQESDRDNLIFIVWGLESEIGFCFAADDAVLRAE